MYALLLRNVESTMKRHIFLHLASCFSLVCSPFLFPTSLSRSCLCSCCLANEANKPPSHVLVPLISTFPPFPVTNLSGSNFWNQPLQSIGLQLWPEETSGASCRHSFLLQKSKPKCLWPAFYSATFSSVLTHTGKCEQETLRERTIRKDMPNSAVFECDRVCGYNKYNFFKPALGL